MNIYDSQTECGLQIADIDVDINSWLQFEGGDFFDELGWAEQVNHSLVDSHFVSVPGVGSLSAWGLPGGDSQGFGWDPHWALSFEVVVLGGVDDLAAGGFQWLHVQSSDGQSIIQTVNYFCFIAPSDRASNKGSIGHSALTTLPKK